MSTWDYYPDNYRQSEVETIVAAARAGECCAVVGLSGSGKSNLLGFIANRLGAEDRLPAFVLVDCNRLAPAATSADLLSELFSLIGAAVQGSAPGPFSFERLQAVIQQRLAAGPTGLCLLFDRFDAVANPAEGAPAEHLFAPAASNLRALRDLFKYDLTYVIAARRPLPANNEMAELFFAHTVWLGPLSLTDARWTVLRYAQRTGLSWDETAVSRLVEASGAYPSFLRAACEAYAAGCGLDLSSLAAHPAVSRRLAEFLADNPSPAELSASRLAGLPLLAHVRQAEPPSAAGGAPNAELTAKEHLLWIHFTAHPRQVCEKDELIHAVWPEDVIFQAGVRDDSLAQLVRRLREKVEQDPSNPQHIHTVPGRGYRFNP